MAWDSSRPVPWERLMREWVVYAGIMAVVFLLFFRDSNIVGALAGVLISGPMYLALGAVLAKFGYQRKSLKEMRTPRAGDDELAAREPTGTEPRARPAPTRRTATGPNRPGGKKRRR